MSNNPPDVILELTHEEATHLLESGEANIRLGFALIMSMASEDIPIEQKQVKAKIIENMRKRFSSINQKLRKAGAREKED